MVYVSASGSLTEKRSPWRLTIFSDLLWGVVNFFGVFVKTLIEPVDPKTRMPYEKPKQRARPGAKDLHPTHKTPSNMKGMDTLKKQQGACASGG